MNILVCFELPVMLHRQVRQCWYLSSHCPEGDLSRLLQWWLLRQSSSQNHPCYRLGSRFRTLRSNILCIWSFDLIWSVPDKICHLSFLFVAILVKYTCSLKGKCSVLQHRISCTLPISLSSLCGIAPIRWTLQKLLASGKPFSLSDSSHAFALSTTP